MEQNEEPNHGIHLHDATVRYSNSPRRWTQINRGPQSPTKSVHPEHSSMAAQLESIHSQPDYGHRTIDFFEDSSEDEGILPGSAITSPDFMPGSRSGSPGKRKRAPPASGQSFVSRCEPKRFGAKEAVADLEDDQKTVGEVPDQGRATSPSVSYHGSIEELETLSANGEALRPPKAVRLSSTQRFRTSGLGWGPQAHQSMSDEGRASTYHDNIDHIVGVHAIAHEVMLRGMLNDEQLFQQANVSTVKLERTSMLPSALRSQDATSSGSGKKKTVSMIPPPIDTQGQHSLPEAIIRTPYPFPATRLYRKDFAEDTPPPLRSPHAGLESVLTVSIRRCNTNSLPRVTSITIPATNNYTAVRESDQHGDEHHQPRSAAFDDHELFRHLRAAYVDLSGPLRFWSARSLQRIAVSGPATRAADADYGWIHQPRSPRVLAHQGLTDTFSEQEILYQYRHPRRGIRKYAFVHWAHRLAAAPTPESRALDRGEGSSSHRRPSVDLVRRKEQPEGLELVVSWSVRRILAVLAMVVGLAVAAALLWVFVGKQTSPALPGLSAGGFHDSGDRVGSGILIGLFVLLVGLTGFAGWLGLSWLVL